jgi:hypothetical protein
MIAGVTMVGAITACVIDPLNPQPLPPGPPGNGASFGMDAAAFPVTPDAGGKSASDSGALGDQDAETTNDGSSPGVPAIDGGDAGDAGDADSGH